jgi:hypothetical protein
LIKSILRLAEGVMCYKAVLSSLILVSILLFTACNANPNSTSQASTNLSATTTHIPHLNINISSIPKLNEATDLDFTITIQTLDLGKQKEGLVNARAWIEFYWINLKGSYTEAKYGVKVPLEDVLVSGDTSWQGNALKEYQIKLHSSIQLPQEGLWKIVGYFSGENWNQPLKSSTKVVLLDGISAKYDRFSQEFKSGALGYLANFNYGDIGNRTPNENTSPIVIIPNISKAPKMGEKATITVQINSLHDVPDYSAKIEFRKNEVGWITASDIVESGIPTWTGDLKANQISQFSIDIKLPDTGEWDIYVEGNSRENEINLQGGYADSIQLTITPTLSYFGWMERTK